MGKLSVTSPIGPIGIDTDEHQLLSLTIEADTHTFTPREPETAIEQATAEALALFFNGDFTVYQQKVALLPLAMSQGTPFQRQVWQSLQQIPRGETRTYQWLAESVKNPKALQAVGQANRRNPFPILVPCHRVIRKSGDLGGYMGHQDPQNNALRIKEKLLQLEQN